MKAEGYKEVLLPVKVPVGDYCSCNNGETVACCEYFNNEGGHSHCFFNFSINHDKSGAIPKPSECLALKESYNFAQKAITKVRAV